jgi:hypothetical protein
VDIFVKLSNIKPISYSDIIGQENHVYCPVDTTQVLSVAAGSPRKPYVTLMDEVCSDGTKYSVECPGDRGYFTWRCPSHKIISTCSEWIDGHGFVEEDTYGATTCKSFTHSADHTVCKCTFAGRRRKLQSGSGEDFAVELTTSWHMESVFPSLSDFLPSPAVTIPEPQATVANTVWALIGVFFFSFLGFSWVDRKESASTKQMKKEQKMAAKSNIASRTTKQFFDRLM